MIALASPRLQFHRLISKDRSRPLSRPLMDKPTRIRVLKGRDGIVKNGKAVLYWMSRDQRVQDNWALIYAQQLARQKSSPLYVCFCLVPRFLEATIRQYDFMLKGLQEVEAELRTLGIPFHLLKGLASIQIPEFLEKNDVGAVVCDFSPLRTPTTWVGDVTNALPDGVYFSQVDAHNIIPCWIASEFEEKQAYLIRPKLEGRLSEFCTEFPRVAAHGFNKVLPSPVDWDDAYKSLEVDQTIKPVSWAVPGTKSAFATLRKFINVRFAGYASLRNNPNERNQSNLSPWRHFGQISNQRVMIEVLKSGPSDNLKSFINEMVVWREMAENFCYYNKNYDNFDGAPGWAASSLKRHLRDKRDYVYTLEQFEMAKTHDALWNAGQMQMVNSGKMHGFMRMYWAKKILEWTKTPEEALRIAVYLNDKYELDGRDPAGYAGCMWSICGVHDRPFQERKVYGQVRYMSYMATTKKFDIEKYIKDVRRGKCLWE